jgi:hypothetical protein
MTSAYYDKICYKCGKTNDENMTFNARKNQFGDKRVKTNIFLCGECSQAWDKLYKQKEGDFARGDLQKRGLICSLTCLLRKKLK